ncbi:MAG: SLOG family protein [Methylococcales bacterium]|nr:SLOG family protein [Methylococcales bacterium]
MISNTDKLTASASNPVIRIIIAGTRTVKEHQVREALSLCPWSGFASAIVSGTANGADEYGERWAEEQNLIVHRFPADWEKYGKSAGPIRNKVMAANAEGLVAVWDGKSKGTANMIKLAADSGLRVFVLWTDTNKTKELSPKGAILKLWADAKRQMAANDNEM